VREREIARLQRGSVSLNNNNNQIQMYKSFFETHTQQEIPKFHKCELCLGRWLGAGSFASVNEILAITLHDNDDNNDDTTAMIHESITTTVGLLRSNKQQQLKQNFYSERTRVTSNTADLSDDDDESEDEDEGHEEAEDYHDVIMQQPSKNGIWSEFEKVEREFMSQNCISMDTRTGEESARYAIKSLRSDLSKNDTTIGMKDLETELKFLSFISHPNIIKVRAYNLNETEMDESFLVLDRLCLTLKERIYEKDWHDQKLMIDQMEHTIESQRVVFFFGRRRSERIRALQILQRDFLLDRLNVARRIASAMDYLHNNWLIYRDIKPQNIGFDVDGEVKLFVSVINLFHL